MKNIPIQDFMDEHRACRAGRRWVAEMGFATCRETFEALCNGKAGNYYKIQNMAGLAYGEAIANISSARAFVDNEKLKLAFPNIYVIVQKLEKTK